MAEDPSKGQNFFEPIAIYATSALKGYINRITEGVDIKGNIIPSTAALIWHANTQDKHDDNLETALALQHQQFFVPHRNMLKLHPLYFLQWGDSRWIGKATNTL